MHLVGYFGIMLRIFIRYKNMLESPQIDNHPRKVTEFQEGDKYARSMEKVASFKGLINEAIEEIKKEHKDTSIIFGKERFGEDGFSVNYKHGVSVYCYVKVGASEMKIRISDHVGRWSGYNVDLRNPKDAGVIIRSMMSQVTAGKLH